MTTLKFQRIATLIFLLVIEIGFPHQAFSQESFFQYQINSVALGFTSNGATDYPWGTGSANKNVFVAQYEHFDQNRFGAIYFAVEDNHGSGMGSDPSNHDTTYLIFNPRISANKILGTNFSLGPIVDLSAALRLDKENYGQYWAKLYGVVATLKIPGFDAGEAGAYVRKATYEGISNSAANMFYEVFLKAKQFSIGPMKINSTTTALLNFRKDVWGREIFVREDLLTPIAFINFPIEAGLRFDWHSYSLPNGLGGGRANRFTPTVLVKFNL